MKNQFLENNVFQLGIVRGFLAKEPYITPNSTKNKLWWCAVRVNTRKCADVNDAKYTVVSTYFDGELAKTFADTAHQYDNVVLWGEYDHVHDALGYDTNRFHALGFEIVGQNDGDEIPFNELVKKKMDELIEEIKRGN